MDFVLETDLSVDFRSRRGVLQHAVIRVKEGEILGLVGQSGSGKTTFALAALGLIEDRDATVSGKVILNGIDIRGKRERDLRSIRGRLVSMIPQSPAAALTPTLSIGGQFREAWLAHAKNWPREGLPRARRLLEACGLQSDDQFLRRYPDQISLGQAQRVLISMALLHDPSLLIADEPTSALDMLTQREVLDLLKRISAERRMSILFISHDLQAVASLCDTLAILHEGTIVECGATEKLFSSPEHPYTRLLLESIPKPRIPAKSSLCADEN
jgi:peptide/nickel transport system ATP-binding protein